VARRGFSREDLIDALHTLMEREGGTPKQYEPHKYADIPSHVTFVKRFGTWRQALQAAGIPLDPMRMGYDRPTLLKWLREVAEALGKAPTQEELRAAGGPVASTYVEHFGSWPAALAELGLEVRTSRRYESEELLEVLRELARELGHTPSISELQARKDLPSPYTIRDRFGRWNEALRMAGLEPGHGGVRRPADSEGAQ
jgi:hypothetical protein